MNVKKRLGLSQQSQHLSCTADNREPSDEDREIDASKRVRKRWDCDVYNFICRLGKPHRLNAGTNTRITERIFSVCSF